MNILITGVSGYIGSHLCKDLSRSGHVISVLRRKSSNITSLTPFIVNDFIIEELDDNFNNIFSGTNIDVVIHLATHFLAEHKHEDIDNLISGNFTLGLRLVDAMVRNKCFKLINFTSSWQNFSSQDDSPVNLYSAIKRAFDDSLKYYTSDSHLKVLNLRIYDTFGPNDYRKKIIPILKKSFEENLKIEMSAGDQLLDFVHISDICKGVDCALNLIQNSDFKVTEYALASFRPIKLREIAQNFARIAGKEDLIQFGGRPYRHREVMIPYYPYPKLPNWEPRICLEEGLADLIKQHGN